MMRFVLKKSISIISTTAIEDYEMQSWLRGRDTKT